MIPDRLLPITVTRIRPAAAQDRYGNPTLDYGAAAARTAIKAWIDQASADEATPDGRTEVIGGWKVITNDDLAANDRLEWNSVTYDLDGPAWPVYTPVGQHHIEARLRRVEG